MEFDETKGFQEKDENLDDVRGTQLVNAMKNMDVGDIRPREVIEVEDDKDQVLSNSNVQVDTSQASSSSQPSDQSNASAPTNQCCNQPMLQEIIHWILSLVIFQKVCKQDRDRHHFVNISHLCHLLNLRR